MRKGVFIEPHNFFARLLKSEELIQISSDAMENSHRPVKYSSFISLGGSFPSPPV